MRNFNTSSEDGKWPRSATDLLEQEKPGPTQSGWAGEGQSGRSPQAHQQWGVLDSESLITAKNEVMGCNTGDR